jgi:antitoxin (DNA-binding transcriptional repressor) of toxin-antitoxin stability system
MLNETAGATIAGEALMKTISHRVLRNQTRKILERVKNGGAFYVTQKGEVAALLIPRAATPFEALLSSGNVRPATNPIDFQALPRVERDAKSAEILSDLRGDS